MAACGVDERDESERNIEKVVGGRVVDVDEGLEARPPVAAASRNIMSFVGASADPLSSEAVGCGES